MREGRLAENIMGRSVFKNINCPIDDINILKPGFGVKFSATKIDENSINIGSTAVVHGFETKDVRGLGRRLISEISGNISLSGTKVTQLVVDIILPLKLREIKLKEIIKEINEFSEKSMIRLVGCYCTVSRFVEVPVITAHGLGVIGKSDFLAPGGMKASDDIIIAGNIACMGTHLMARRYIDEKKKILPEYMIAEALAMSEYQDIAPVSELAIKNGATAVYNAGEGGIYGALWEIGEASDMGMEIQLANIPVAQETIELSEIYDIDPYSLLSQGCLVISCERGEDMVRILKEHNISACVAGKAKKGNDRVLLRDDERRFIEPPAMDEIYRLFDKKTV